jgi:hypothetical protein
MSDLNTSQQGIRNSARVGLLFKQKPLHAVVGCFTGSPRPMTWAAAPFAINYELLKVKKKRTFSVIKFFLFSLQANNYDSNSLTKATNVNLSICS